jgi:hypothetical protein
MGATPTKQPELYLVTTEMTLEHFLAHCSAERTPIVVSRTETGKITLRENAKGGTRGVSRAACETFHRNLSEKYTRTRILSHSKDFIILDLNSAKPGREMFFMVEDVAFASWAWGLTSLVLNKGRPQ